MCVSGAGSFTASAKLQGRNGEEINSQATLKILGVILNVDCSF